MGGGLLIVIFTFGTGNFLWRRGNADGDGDGDFPRLVPGSNLYVWKLSGFVAIPQAGGRKYKFIKFVRAFTGGGAGNAGQRRPNLNWMCK